jgi:GABA(A) receptor-associated protein
MEKYKRYKNKILIYKHILMSKPSYITEFKKNSLDKRTELNTQLKTKYPDRLGIIVSKRENSQAPDISKKKFLAPSDITMHQLIYIFRKRINLKESQGVFFFINNTLLLSSSGTLIGEIYNKHKEKDGFLYITYDVENTFG